MTTEYIFSDLEKIAVEKNLISDEFENDKWQVVDYESYSSTGFLTILQDNHDYQMPFIDEIFKVKGKNVIVVREAFDRYKF